MDDTSSLPTTNIINLSYDRSMFFLVFFSFFLKKNRSWREKTCKEVELMERAQQRIKLKQLKVIVYEYHLCHTLKWGEKRRRKKGKGQGRQKVRSRRASLVESLKSRMKEEHNRVVVRIKTRINRGQKQGGRLFVFLTVSEWFL